MSQSKQPITSLKIANYLKSKGINANRLQIKAVGETQLVNSCSCSKNDTPCTEKEFQENRRASFKISKSKASTKTVNQNL